MIIFIVLCLATLAGLWKLFEKAGEPGWTVLIPGYNLYVWLRLIKKPLWWLVLLAIPFINVFMLWLMMTELVKSFRQFKFYHQAMAVLIPFIYFPYMGFKPEYTYLHPDEHPKIKKSFVRSWSEAIIFAVVAVTIINTFWFQHYKIPTPSMEKTLLVGDHLWVSKFTYGAKLPNTPLTMPLTHNTMPTASASKSYLEWIQWPYFRFPGLKTIKNKDIVVFNYPSGDTLASRIPAQNYYSLVRNLGRERVWNDKRNFGEIIARPVDKRDNYIKRCIAIPGDTLQIVQGAVFINGQKQTYPTGIQHHYRVETDGRPIPAHMFEKLNIDKSYPNGKVYSLVLTNEAAEALKHLPNVRAVVPGFSPATYYNPDVFPFNANYQWNIDNFGPLYIPQKGITVELNLDNLCLYERIIQAYEGNELLVKAGKIYINGAEASSYTFQMDYYWMMGDNRHNSLDSRYWGFVPEDHIVGKAAFVWLSLEPNKSFPSNIRWNKMFRIAR